MDIMRNYKENFKNNQMNEVSSTGPNSISVRTKSTNINTDLEVSTQTGSHFFHKCLLHFWCHLFLYCFDYVIHEVNNLHN